MEKLIDVLNATKVVEQKFVNEYKDIKSVYLADVKKVVEPFFDMNMDNFEKYDSGQVGNFVLHQNRLEVAKLSPAKMRAVSSLFFSILDSRTTNPINSNKDIKL